MLVGVLLKLDACAMARPSALPYLQQLYSIRPVSRRQSPACSRWASAPRDEQTVVTQQ